MKKLKILIVLIVLLLAWPVLWAGDEALCSRGEVYVGDGPPGTYICRDARGRESLYLLAGGDQAPEAEWSFAAAISAAYVRQTTLDDAGEEQSEFLLAALTGVEFWRSPASGRLGYGFAIELAGLPDEEERTPRIVPAGSVCLGTPGVHACVGAALDPQDENGVALLVGLSTGIGGGS